MIPEDVQYHVHQLTELFTSAQKHYHQLVLCGGGEWKDRTEILKSFASKATISYFALGAPLSQVLMNLSLRDRQIQVESKVSELLSELGSGGFALDFIEILFDSSLRVDPLRLLQTLSQDCVLLAAWPGEYENGRFSYAEPPHPEYYSKHAPDILYYSIDK